MFSEKETVHSHCYILQILTPFLRQSWYWSPDNVRVIIFVVNTEKSTFIATEDSIRKNILPVLRDKRFVVCLDILFGRYVASWEWRSSVLNLFCDSSWTEGEVRRRQPSYIQKLPRQLPCWNLRLRDTQRQRCCECTNYSVLPRAVLFTWRRLPPGLVPCWGTQVVTRRTHQSTFTDLDFDMSAYLCTSIHHQQRVRWK